MIPDWLARDPWFPLDAPIRTTPAELRRGRQFLLDVVAQFQVTLAPRYQKVAKPPPQNGHITYCNIFLWDVTRALGCEIPHYVDAATRSKPYRFASDSAELDANAVAAWLEVHGGDYGWYPSNRAQAIQLVEEGMPVAAAWINPTGDGHVALGVPALSGAGHLHTAQAGATNFANALLEVGFGPHEPKLYFHA